MTTVVRLPFPPSTNNLFINVKKGRIKSQRYDYWLMEARVDLLRQRPVKVGGPVNLTLEFKEPDKRLRDLDNLAKAPLDFLVAHGLIEADNNSIVRKINLAWSDDVEGCRITIEPLFHRVPEKGKDNAEAA